MALGLYHDAECQRPVSDADPFVSKHTNAGEPVVTKLFIGNDGKRKGVNTDVPGEIALIYTNLKIQVEGRKIQLEASLSPSTGDDTLTVVRGMNGTTRATHLANATIYNCGIVDITPTSHPVFVRVTPPSGLPAQKSRSIYVVVQSDEEVY